MSDLRSLWLGGLATLLCVAMLAGCEEHRPETTGDPRDPELSSADRSTAGAPSAAEQADTGGDNARPAFDGVVAEHAFPGERFSHVWGTDEQIWVLGGSSASDPGCGPNRFRFNTTLRRRTNADFDELEQPATSLILGLHGSGASDVWMVGAAGGVFQFDGEKWQTHDVRAAKDLDFQEVPCWELSLRSVFARSPTDVWVVGYILESSSGHGLILHYDGQAWERHVVDADDGFFDVWAASERDVWVVGASGLLFRYDGTTWQRANPSTEHYLWSVLGTAPDDVWTVGNTGVAAHFDGRDWALIESSQDHARRRALAGNLQGGVWSLVTTGLDAESAHWQQSVQRWNGAAWQTEWSTTDRNSELQDLYMTPNGALWGVGPRIIRFR